MTPIDCLRNKITEIDSEIVRAYNINSDSKSKIVDNQFKQDKETELTKLKELKKSYEFAIQNLIEI